MAEPLLWFDSQDPAHPSAERSRLATVAGPILTIRDGQAHLDDHPIPGGARPFELLAHLRDRHPGWWCGYLGYDLKNALERLESRNPDPVGAPDLWFARFASMTDLEPGTDPLPPSGPYRLSEPVPGLDRATYLDRVHRAQAAIREGECYELNLCYPLGADFRGDPLGLYRRMRQAAGVPFGAYLDTGDLQLCCLSPERFLRFRDGRLRSDPIKGTAPRESDPAILAADAKNRAENLMIVDLVRHDFSRVCEPGSVQVEALFDIQTFGTVHQMVSVVTGTPRPNTPPEHLLEACFPMGSMTGAPKIRAMEWIETLEPWRRGAYSGAIGAIAPDGSFDFNVVIRTAAVRNGRAVYGVGGAITSDSDPLAEWEETRLKARVFRSAVT